MARSTEKLMITTSARTDGAARLGVSNLASRLWGGVRLEGAYLLQTGMSDSPELKHQRSE